MHFENPTPGIVDLLMAMFSNIWDMINTYVKQIFF